MPDFAIYVVHTAELGADVRAVSRRKDYRTTALSRYVLRFPSFEAAEYHRRRSLAPRPLRRYIVDTIPPLAECGRTLPRPPALEQLELPI
jgi:hypothetical protein